MPRVEVRSDEPLEKALRRFKRMLEREGILKALKAKKHYEKPSERKRREMRQAISRRARAVGSIRVLVPPCLRFCAPHVV